MISFLEIIMFKITTAILFFSYTFTSLTEDCSNNPCMLDKAIDSAQNNRVKDPSSPVFSCMLSQWNAKLVDSETDLSSNIETYDVFGYERFLACYRSASKIGAAGEIGVDTEKRKVPNGTRFRARVVCKNGTCSTEWKDTECCYTIDLEKY